MWRGIGLSNIYWVNAYLFPFNIGEPLCNPEESKTIKVPALADNLMDFSGYSLLILSGLYLKLLLKLFVNNLLATLWVFGMY